MLSKVKPQLAQQGLILIKVEKWHGFFGGVGAVGRKNVSTMSPKALARSGKARSAMVAGGVLGAGAMGRRRGSGTGRRTPGRPTGMYGY